MFKKYKETIKTMMTEKRYIHCINVSKQAVLLAKQYNGDVKKAELAGLLHDITKDFSTAEQLQIINRNAIILDEIEQNAPELLHSVSGSVLIKEKFNINDTDILNSVRYHTTGRAEMSLLEKIIFIADFTSEDRNYSDINIMRKKATTSLDEAIFYAISFTISNLAKKGQIIHPRSLDLYNKIIIEKEV